MQVIKFGCTALQGTNKAGVLTPDADGYYEMVIGGLNIFNSAGQLYTYEGAKALFENSSQFKRRVARGSLRGEVGHPRQEPGMSEDAFIHRIMEIRETNVCVHFKEVWLDFSKMKDASGRAVVAIMAKLKPSGPLGDFLQKQINNKSENVCFSIRAFTKDYYESGIAKRDLKNIITWDYVTEPGIHIANKYSSPALENLSETTVTENQLKRVANKTVNSLATESSKMIANEVLNSLGFNLPKGSHAAFTKW